MKITCLVNNFSKNKDLIDEHGLSFYIEKDTNQVLSPEEQIDGHVDDSYNTNTEYRKETIQKDGRTYTLVEDSGNTEGIIRRERVRRS